MGRQKRLNKRVPKSEIENGPDIYTDPKDQFIRSRYYVTLLDLAEQWEKHGGYSHRLLATRSGKEGWQELRKDYWEGIRKEGAKELDNNRIKEMKALVLQANKEHFDSGGSLISTGYKISKQFWDKEGWKKIKPKEAARILPQIYKTGVELQRKGLGLADKVVRVQHTREITYSIVQIIAKYVTDSQTFESIIQDMEQLIDDEEKTLEGEVNSTLDEMRRSDDRE